MLTVRKARMEDARAGAILQVEGWRFTYGGFMPADFLASLDFVEFTGRWEQAIQANDPLHPRWVALLDDKLIGFVTGAVPKLEVPGYPNELGAIYTQPGLQRAGVGRALITTFKENLLSRGESAFHLWVGKQNKRAHHFYRAMNGEIVAERSDRHFGGMQIPEYAFGFRL